MRFFIVFLAISGAFIFGVSTGLYKHFPFNLIVDTKNLISSNTKTGNITKFSMCDIPISKYVKKDSHAFIGHAYGSEKNNKDDGYISKNALNFIQNNKFNLKTIVFTGDVFGIPSIDKWNKLKFDIGSEIDILVAPGNHDIKRPDSRDIFLLSRFGEKIYPSIKYINKTPLILENSIDSNWKTLASTIDIANNLKSESIIIARHNPPTIDLSSVTNSESGASSNLETVEELVKKFNEDKKFYWLIGDGGKSPYLPRLSCYNFKNHTFIINGLGSISGDSIVIYNEKRFYEYKIEF